MIRRFLSISVFMATILLATFGQDIFGREDIKTWARVIEKQAPARTHQAMKTTDKFLAQLAPEAGPAGDAPQVCMREDISKIQ